MNKNENHRGHISAVYLCTYIHGCTYIHTFMEAHTVQYSSNTLYVLNHCRIRVRIRIITRIWIRTIKVILVHHTYGHTCTYIYGSTLQNSINKY